MRLTKNSYGLDIEGHSGQQHHQLPVPSAFIRVHPRFVRDAAGLIWLLTNED